MPSVKKGEKQSDYMARCVPMLTKEGHKHEQAVAQCINMFKEHWKAKGSTLPDENSEEFSKLLETFAWEDCPECVKFEYDIKKSHGIFEIDMSSAKVTTKCDNCNETIDTNKPKPKKDKNGKTISTINPSFQAELEYPIDSGETKKYHFCSELCLYNYLHKRNKSR
jgi:hypothetical protein